MAAFLGIDIGNRYTKIVELERKPSLSLLNYFLFATPYSSQGQQGPRQLDAKIFWDEIARHIPLKRIKASKIGINLPSSQTTTMTLLLPRVTKSELAMVALNEARRKMIPASGPGHIFESSVVGTRITAKIPRLEVLVVRSEKSYVQQILELFRPVGCSPLLITLSGFILSSMAAQEILNKHEVDTAFVDIGATSINTSILREGKLAFFRNTAYGLWDIVQDFSQRLSLSEDEAEVIIREKGVVEVDFDLKDRVALAEEIMRQKYEAGLRSQEANQKQEVNLLELRMLWQGHIDRTIHEVRRSLAYYKDQSEGRRVEHIYFLGGGCQIKNLVNLLIKQIGGQWEIVLPFKAIPVAAERLAQDVYSAPIFAGAAALALSMAPKGKAADIINFLPFELKRKGHIAARRLIILAAKIILVSLLSVLSAGIFINSRVVTAVLKKTEVDLQKVKDVSETLKDLSRRDRKIKIESAQIQEIIDKRPDFYPLLFGLAKNTPREVMLTQIAIYKVEAPAYPLEQPMPLDAETEVDADVSYIDASQPAPTVPLSIDTYTIEIKAEVFTDYERASLIIANMSAALGKTGFFGNVRPSALQLEKISPRVAPDTQETLSLTRQKKRAFSITADIAFSK
jgi:type IV pilus assembly protein PilM